jgi:hypothetical protein
MTHYSLIEISDSQEVDASWYQKRAVANCTATYYTTNNLLEAWGLAIPLTRLHYPGCSCEQGDYPNHVCGVAPPPTG